MGVSSEEGVIHTHLEEHYPKVFGWHAVESWNIRSSEWMSSVSKLKDHSHRSLKLREDGAVVSSPVGSEPLRAEEEASSQNEWASVVVVTPLQTVVGSSLHETSISVVDVTMLVLGSISLHVDGVKWHCPGVSAENSGLIHVIPSGVHPV